MNKKIKKLAALMNENKLEVLYSIYQCTGDICACNIVDNLNIPKNLLSYHIKTLRGLDFIEEVKCGRFKKYQVKQDKISEVENILKLVEMIK